MHPVDLGCFFWVGKNMGLRWRWREVGWELGRSEWDMFWGCFPQECRLPQVTSDMTTWSDWGTPTKRQDVSHNPKTSEHPPILSGVFFMIDTVMKKGLFLCVPPEEYDCWWWSSETERGGCQTQLSTRENSHQAQQYTSPGFFYLEKNWGRLFWTNCPITKSQA